MLIFFHKAFITIDPSIAKMAILSKNSAAIPDQFAQVTNVVKKYVNSLNCAEMVQHVGKKRRHKSDSAHVQSNL